MQFAGQHDIFVSKSFNNMCMRRKQPDLKYLSCCTFFMQNTTKYLDDIILMHYAKNTHSIANIF